MSGKLSQRAREAAKDFGEFTVDDLILRLSAKTYREKKDIQSAISRFCKYGEVLLLRPGLYRYEGKQALSLTQKIWRAMMIKGQFTKKDLVRLSGASFSRVNNYVGFLKRSGIVNRAAKLTGNTALYSLSDAERAPLNHPRMKKSGRKK
ncbi:MAG: hypothetical protein AB1512_13525 [Thermodesulfobacteriota bacterium]